MIHRFLFVLLLLSNLGLSVEYPCGVFERTEPGSIPLQYAPAPGVTLPAAIDLSSKLPKIGNQGSGTPSCVGWAVAYYLKTHQEQAERNWGLDVTSHKFSPLWVFNQIKRKDQYGRYGAHIEDALNLITSRGCATMADFNPSSIFTLPSSTSYLKYGFGGWNTVQRDVTSVKTVLAQCRPVIASIKVYPDFDSLSPENHTYSNVNGNNRGGHAICIIGYDDARKSFKFANSWGTAWGISGYGWISYAMITNTSAVRALFEARDIIEDRRIVGSSPPPGYGKPMLPATFSWDLTCYGQGNYSTQENLVVGRVRATLERGIRAGEKISLIVYGIDGAVVEPPTTVEVLTVNASTIEIRVVGAAGPPGYRGSLGVACIIDYPSGGRMGRTISIPLGPPPPTTATATISGNG